MAARVAFRQVSTGSFVFAAPAGVRPRTYEQVTPGLNTSRPMVESPSA
jgi:hypothetical protein